MTADAARPRWTCWSSAAGRPAWRWATSWRSGTCGSRSWTPARRSGLRGARAGTRCGCSPPAAYDNLPGLPFPAAADTYPGKDDVADYLRAYAAEFELPVRLDTTVTSLARAGDGSYLVKAGADALEARPGGRRHRAVPGAVHPACRGGPPAGRAPAAQRRLPTPGAAAARPGARRRRGELRLPDRPGAVRDPDGGALGRQADPHRAAAAAGTRRLVVGLGPAAGPRDRGLAAGTAAGRPRPDRGSRPAAAGPPPRHHDSGPGSTPWPAATSASPTAPTAEYDAVVWATGFTHGRLVDRRPGRHRRARAAAAVARESLPSPGLYTLGRSWQHTRGSALLGWVGNDAAFLAEQIASRAG